MNPAPALSLAENVANKIKQMILSGSLVNVLPGERELGNRLSVGRETVRKALTILEKENWIAPARIKVPRRILKAAADNMGPDASSFPIQEKKATIGFLTSQPIKRLAQSVLVEVYTILKILEEDGISVRIFEAPWLLGNNPDKRLAKLVGKSECVCWILHRSSEQSQLWFKTHGIPCIVRGTSYQSSNLPYLDPSCGTAFVEQGAQNRRVVPPSGSFERPPPDAERLLRFFGTGLESRSDSHSL